jgi:hypothetical protein
VGTRGFFWKHESSSMIEPQTLSTRFGFILPHDRLTLFFKTTYFFILLLPLALLFEIVSQIPGVRRIAIFRSAFTYLSSVQMYQERRARQGGTLVDFDQSRRISIQRRFVRRIIEMAERDYDRWYIAAHSLGSVIALKGLMLDGNAFARLITQNKWQDTRLDPYKTTLVPPSESYPDQPKCPLWLHPDSAVDMKLLLRGLRGLVTYGSPLETFARTWPAIVLIDRQALQPGQKLSPDFEWLNLHDPVDVVASRLSSFGFADSETKGIMKPKNLQCRSSCCILTAHTSYLKPKSTNLNYRALPALFWWLMEPNKCFTVSEETGAFLIGKKQAGVRKIFALLQWALVLVAGFVIWPYSLIVVARPLLSVVAVLLYFAEGLYESVENHWLLFQQWIHSMIMTPHLYRNIVNALWITLCVSVALLIAGFVQPCRSLPRQKKGNARHSNHSETSASSASSTMILMETP